MLLVENIKFGVYMTDNLGKIEELFHRKNRKEALDYFYEGYHAQMKKKYARAIEMYQKSINVSPTPEAHTFLGWAYSFLGEFNSAIDQCQSAIDLDPDFGNPYNDIGAYLIAQGYYDQAIPYLRQALKAKRYRAYHFAHYNLARVYEHEGNYLNAYRHYKKALAHEPRYKIARLGMDRVLKKIHKAA